MVASEYPREGDDRTPSTPERRIDLCDDVELVVRPPSAQREPQGHSCAICADWPALRFLAPNAVDQWTRCGLQCPSCGRRPIKTYRIVPEKP